MVWKTLQTCAGILLAAITRDHRLLATQESDFFKQLKSSQPFFVMAGPNVIQSEEHVLKLARQIKAITDKLGLTLVFKSSFDKANRTSATSFRGPGLEEGLRSVTFILLLLHRAPCCRQSATLTNKIGMIAGCFRK